MWIWDRPGWPEWDYALRADTVKVLKDIHTRRKQLAKESGQTPELVARAVKGALLREASSTSEIEGEHIPYDDLRNAVAGVDPAEDGDPRAAGVVGMLEACRAAPVLDRHVLFDMHERLLGYLRGARAPGTPLQIGGFRKTNVHISSPMRGVIYEAPGPEQVERLMANYLDWLQRPLTLPMNATPEPLHDQSLLSPVKAAVAHIWFECVHPFGDGNGRIGRAIAERVLRGPGKGAGYLATAIDVRREEYYEELGKYGKDSQGNDISPWVNWFVDICRQSLDWEWERMHFERDRQTFFEGVGANLSTRVRRALEAILDDWPGGRFYAGVQEADWDALLDGQAPPGAELDALSNRDIFAPGEEPGYYNVLEHFRHVGDKLFEVGVHRIPSSCDAPSDAKSRPSSPSPS